MSYVQLEDSSGYGYLLAPVGKYKLNNKVDPSMMLWAVIGANVGCKDLYEAITKKILPFRNDGWEEHALTHVCKKYARHDNGNDDDEMEESVHHTNLGSCPLAQTNTLFPVLQYH
jgi:hypothetical protein